MAVLGIPLPEVVLVALQTMLLQSLWVALVMALSSLTRDLARFVLAAGAVLVSFILLMSIGIGVAMRNVTEGPRLHEVTERSAVGPADGVVDAAVADRGGRRCRSSCNTAPGRRDSPQAQASQHSP